MTEPCTREFCQLCQRQTGKLTLWCLWFERGSWKQAVTSNIIPSRNTSIFGGLLINGKDRFRLNLVHMETGAVMRKDYKRPLPQWVNEPLQRALILANPSLLPDLHKRPREKAKS